MAAAALELRQERCHAHGRDRALHQEAGGRRTPQHYSTTATGMLANTTAIGCSWMGYTLSIRHALIGWRREEGPHHTWCRDPDAATHAESLQPLSEREPSPALSHTELGMVGDEGEDESGEGMNTTV